MLDDAELLLGVSRHLSTYAISSAHAALDFHQVGPFDTGSDRPFFAAFQCSCSRSPGRTMTAAYCERIVTALSLVFSGLHDTWALSAATRAATIMAAHDSVAWGFRLPGRTAMRLHCGVSPIGA